MCGNAAGKVKQQVVNAVAPLTTAVVNAAWAAKTAVAYANSTTDGGLGINGLDYVIDRYSRSLLKYH